MIECKKCGKINDDDSLFCMECGAKLDFVLSKVKSGEEKSTESSTNEKNDSWKCEACGFENQSANSFCGGCGAKKPELSNYAKQIVAKLEDEISNLKQLLQVEKENVLKAKNSDEINGIKVLLDVEKDKYSNVVFELNNAKLEIEKLKEDLAKKTDELSSRNSNLPIENNTNVVIEKELEEMKARCNELNMKYAESESLRNELEKELAFTKNNQRKFCRYCGHTLED